MNVVTVTDLLGLVPVLAAAFGVVLGAVALVTGWRMFSDRSLGRRRGVVVPLVGVIVWVGGGVR